MRLYRCSPARCVSGLRASSDLQAPVRREEQREPCQHRGGGGSSSRPMSVWVVAAPRVLSCSYSQGGSAVLVLSIRRGGYVSTCPFSAVRL